MREVFTRLQTLNTLCASGLERNAMKMSEEVGEFHAAVLKMVGRKSAKGKARSVLKTEAVSEGLDVILATLGALMDLGVTYDEFVQGLDRTCDTFESRIHGIKESGQAEESESQP